MTPPPESFIPFTQDEVELFEASVANIYYNHKFVVIAGDTNSRTAQLPDFAVQSDTFLMVFWGCRSDGHGSDDK